MRSCSRPPKSCSAGRSVMITENICNGPGVSDDDFLSRAHVEPGAIIINNCFNGGDGQSYPDTSQASGNTFCGNVGVGNRSGHQTLFSTFGSETVLYQYSGIHPSSQIPAWYYQQCVPPPAGFAAPFATFKTDGIGENPRDSKTKRARPKDTLKGLGFLREMAARLTNIILKALTPRGRQGAKK